MLAQMLSNREAAEQILQEQFLTTWAEARRRPLGSHQSVGASLMIRARLAAVEWLRSQRNLPPVPEACVETIRHSADWLPRPDSIALIDSRSQMFQKVLNQLPKHQRDVLRLVVSEGYTEQEMALRLAEPLARMRAELNAALTFFRHRLHAVLGTWTANI